MVNGEQFKKLRKRHCTSIMQLIKLGAKKKLLASYKKTR